MIQIPYFPRPRTEVLARVRQQLHAIDNRNIDFFVFICHSWQKEHKTTTWDQ
jgi:siderophore synthetase component